MLHKTYLSFLHATIECIYKIQWFWHKEQMARCQCYLFIITPDGSQTYSNYTNVIVLRGTWCMCALVCDESVWVSDATWWAVAVRCRVVARFVSVCLMQRVNADWLCPAAVNAVYKFQLSLCLGSLVPPPILGKVLEYFLKYITNSFSNYQPASDR